MSTDVWTDTTLTDGDNPWGVTDNTADDSSTSDSGGFGDGSNDWWGGITDFASDPTQAIEDPYGTLAGTADAAALNFDEGAGGLYSLIDGEEGNTAGPGDSEMWTPTPDDLERSWDDLNDAAEDVTPRWLSWVLDNQEAVLVLLVVLVALWATDGTVGTTSGA